jgi:pilus assembly protein CpaB
MARMEGLTLARGNRTLLLVAMLAGLAAAVLVFVALANQSESGGSSGALPGGATVKTVVAAQDIAAGTEVTADMVGVADVPRDLAVTGAFGDTAPVLGQVTSTPLAAGEAITPSKIGTEVENVGIDVVLRDGMRAIAVQVDEVTAVGGNVRPGAFLDISAVFEDADGNATARMVLQNVEVIAVAQEAQEPAPAAGDGAQDGLNSGNVPEDFEVQPGAATLTLAVTPQDTLTLALVQETAVRVYASLRPYGEDAPAEVTPVDLSSILD